MRRARKVQNTKPKHAVLVLKPTRGSETESLWCDYEKYGRINRVIRKRCLLFYLSRVATYSTEAPISSHWKHLIIFHLVGFVYGGLILYTLFFYKVVYTKIYTLTLYLFFG